MSCTGETQEAQLYRRESAHSASLYRSAKTCDIVE